MTLRIWYSRCIQGPGFQFSSTFYIKYFKISSSLSAWAIPYLFTNAPPESWPGLWWGKFGSFGRVVCLFELWVGLVPSPSKCFPDQVLFFQAFWTFSSKWMTKAINSLQSRGAPSGSTVYLTLADSFLWALLIFTFIRMTHAIPIRKHILAKFHQCVISWMILVISILTIDFFYTSNHGGNSPNSKQDFSHFNNDNFLNFDDWNCKNDFRNDTDASQNYPSQ